MNTGNNLIYLIFSMMLAVLVISILLLRLNLRGLSMSISVPQPVFAGQPSRMKINIKNSKARAAAYSLRVHLPEGMQGEGYVNHIQAASESGCGADVKFSRRGIYRYGSFTIESGFPFIFLTKRINARVEGEVIVYPKIIETGHLSDMTGRGDESQTIKRGKGSEILGIRDFSSGDDTKSIHWKASAKAERLMVKEFSEELPRTFSIVLDNAGQFNKSAFERSVSYAAGAAMKLIEAGYYVRLISCDHALPYGAGVEHLYKILDYLAVVQESDGVECTLDAEFEGMNLFVLKSESSPLRGMVSEDDLAVYGTRL